MIWAISFALVAISMLAMTSAPKQSAAEFSEVNFPVVSESTEVPLVLGARWVTAPGVLDYGDYRSKEIRA